MRSEPVNIAIFASGSGSNAQKIIEYFQDREDVHVAVVMCNNKDALVLEKAKNFGVPTRVFGRKEFFEQDVILQELKSSNITWIVLAGFLWLVPDYLVKAYPCRILNIHPALLPMYGGKGMHGMNVHRAVLEAKEKKSGITIHFVNEKYDDGTIVFQDFCPVDDCNTAEDIAQKVLALEHAHFPRIIDEVIKKSNS